MNGFNYENCKHDKGFCYKGPAKKYKCILQIGCLLTITWLTTFLIMEWRNHCHFTVKPMQVLYKCHLKVVHIVLCPPVTSNGSTQNQPNVGTIFSNITFHLSQPVPPLWQKEVRCGRSWAFYYRKSIWTPWVCHNIYLIYLNIGPKDSIIHYI